MSPPTTGAEDAVEFHDEPGKEKFRLVHPAGSQTTVDGKGTVTIADALGTP